ncbi:diguanylate cyclase [Herbaspirillum frisingense]|uniref:GGDEF domain-containing protein n=1 Tax=Herbaspirillum frisingense TaxID=92645 RepID=UPI001603FD54|nr:sensor domain-containing diguanylate cyclase [Herbaspirillum frisingense]QNB06115.1 diguanylate cyclase [Herbaspirillum frisingense]
MERLEKYLVGTCATVLVMTVLLCGSILYKSYRQTETAALSNSLNVARLAQRSISSNIEAMSVAMDTIGSRFSYHPQALHALPELDQRFYLFGTTAALRHVVAIAIMDEAGEVLAISRNGMDEFMQGLAASPGFTVHRDDPTKGLYISPPIMVKLGNELPMMILSKPLLRGDGTFAGVVLMALDLSFFRDLFNVVDIDSNSVVSLYSYEGLVYMRIPFDEKVIGTTLKSGAFTELAKNEEGKIFAISQHDGVKRMYVYSRISEIPLLVFVGSDVADIFSEWHEILYTVLWVLCASILVFLLLFKRLKKEFSARIASEEKLKELVSIDSLTGLLNRRALDELLTALWSRTQRNQNSIFTILFIDLDFFKQYNDTYGHKAGDMVLSSLAHCISDQLARPSDQAARYGGEEFVILLEDTDAAGANQIAQRLLETIRELGLVHCQSPFGIVSASIGAATLRRGQHQSMDDVIKAADAALYEAKNSGRNQVRMLVG